MRDDRGVWARTLQLRVGSPVETRRGAGSGEWGTVVDGLGSTTAVGSCLRDARVACGDAREQTNATGVVGDAGGGDQHGQEEVECVDADVTFASRDLLPASRPFPLRSARQAVGVGSSSSLRASARSLGYGHCRRGMFS